MNCGTFVSSDNSVNRARSHANTFTQNTLTADIVADGCVHTEQGSAARVPDPNRLSEQKTNSHLHQLEHPNTEFTAKAYTDFM